MEKSVRSGESVNTPCHPWFNSPCKESRCKRNRQQAQAYLYRRRCPPKDGTPSLRSISPLRRSFAEGSHRFPFLASSTAPVDASDQPLFDISRQLFKRRFTDHADKHRRFRHADLCHSVFHIDDDFTRQKITD